MQSGAGTRNIDGRNGRGRGASTASMMRRRRTEGGEVTSERRRSRRETSGIGGTVMKGGDTIIIDSKSGRPIYRRIYWLGRVV